MTADLSADLRALQEDLQVKLGRGFDHQQPSGSAAVADRDEPVAKRKPSVGKFNLLFRFHRKTKNVSLFDLFKMAM